MTPHAAATARGMLTGREVAQRLSISQSTLARMVRAKKITRYKFGYCTMRFKHSDVQAFIDGARK